MFRRWWERVIGGPVAGLHDGIGPVLVVLNFWDPMLKPTWLSLDQLSAGQTVPAFLRVPKTTLNKEAYQSI
jgi:hypothetical protein